jgi:amino acid transporter
MTTTAPTAAQLTPRLSLASIVLFGVAYMSPAIVMLTFGVIGTVSQGAAPAAYLLATLAMSLTALSYGKMARLFPVSGSAYTYARKVIGSRVGFLVGWAILLDYFFLPMVAWLISALYLNAQFPVIPVWGWLLIQIVVTTTINVAGIVLADRVNKVLMTLTVIGITTFVFMCLKHLGADTPDSLAAPLWNPTTSVAAISAGAAIAAYSFLGFDAISTLSEETMNPRRNIPRGILLAVLVGGLIFTTVSYVMQLVNPATDFEDPSVAAYAMSVVVGGEAFADIINLFIMVGGFASCLAIQASTSRLMYVMGRDGVLPRRFFGRLHPKLKTPALNILLVGVVGMFAVNLSLETATSFINFGAFLTFAVVNLCVVVHFVRQRRRHQHLSVLGYLLVPVLGAAVDLYLLTQLGPIAVYLGLGWMALGIIYLTVLTRGFRTAPPEMHVGTEATAQPEEATAATLTSS